MCKVKLITDFRDFYDHWFDMDGVPFERMSRNNISRSEGLQRLSAMGLQVPNWGKASALEKTVFPGTLLVVCHDQYAHRGEEKEKLQAVEAAEQYPDDLAMVYIVPPLADEYLTRGSKRHSYRYLRIGVCPFFLMYESDDTWRSNCGNVQITYCQRPKFLEGFQDYERFPMLAIDFVVSYTGLWAAIDYNTSPGLRYTPIQEEASGEQIVEWIKAWYEYKNLQDIVGW